MTTDHGRPSGRPAVTSREEIEHVAFALFARDGYERTSMARIADEVGIGRRTLFRHVESKHDIAWGSFDRELPRLADLLREAPASLPLRDAVMEAVLQVNDEAAADPDHVARMRLILHEPSLQSHSAARYAQWRAVIEQFVVDRADCAPGDPLPRLVAFATNAVAIAAYAEWVRDPGRSFRACFEAARRMLRDHVA